MKPVTWALDCIPSYAGVERVQVRPCMAPPHLLRHQPHQTPGEGFLQRAAIEALFLQERGITALPA
jgi:hypothetical protein